MTYPPGDPRRPHGQDDVTAWGRPPDQPGQPVQPGQPGQPPQQFQYPAAPPFTPAHGVGTPPGTPPGTPAGDPSQQPAKPKKGLRKADTLSLVLVFVIVLALVAAGLLGGEIYARNRADTVIAQATQCVTNDTAEVSFGPTPFLWQHFSGHYDDISITTAGNQIRDAKGMKAEINIDDVRLNGGNGSQGTIGALDATITWSSQGITETIQNSIPLIGGFVTGVKTNPGDGTLELDAALGSIIAKPDVVDGGIGLKVVSLSGLGFILPSEAVQPALDAFSAKLTENYPLGIKADSVQVTADGVIAKFSTRNAEIPQENRDPCFAGI